MKVLPRQGEVAAKLTEGEDGGTLTIVRAADLPLHHSADAERSPSPWRGRISTWGYFSSASIPGVSTCGNTRGSAAPGA